MASETFKVGSITFQGRKYVDARDLLAYVRSMERIFEKGNTIAQEDTAKNFQTLITILEGNS